MIFHIAKILKIQDLWNSINDLLTIIKAYLKDIILNISDLIKQISNDNFQNKDNNNTLINYLKLLKRIIPKNRPDLKGEITINAPHQGNTGTAWLKVQIEKLRVE